MCIAVPDKTPKRQAEDLKDLIVAYAKQETLDPIKQSGRFVGFGVGGALVIAIGVLFLAVGTLRMLRTEFPGTFDGNFSAFAYLIVIVLLGAFAAAFASIARRRPSKDSE